MSERIDLLLIDPQVDFCDPSGALYVQGAENDMANVASMIDRFGSKIKMIHVTLDCHHFIDVAHPAMWRGSDGKHPDLFSVITAQEMRDGKWTPIFLQHKQRFIDYCEALATSGKFPLCIWPPHCLIGSIGNTVFPVLFDALRRWEENSNKNVDYVTKGSNPYTEHYSAVKAEVTDPTDPTTQLNTKLIQTLMDADKILIAGEAGSHCVKNTVEDIADGFGNDSYVQKMVLLTDGVSPVISPFVDFPTIQAAFVADMEARGMQTALSTAF